MKKVLTVALLVVLVVALATTVKAATPSEKLYSYVSQTFIIAGQEVKVPAKYLSEAKSYLEKNEITEDNYKYIKAQIDSTVDIMDREEVTDIFALKGTARDVVVSNVKAAAAELGITIKYDANTNEVTLVGEDGEAITAFTLDDKLPQTDVVNYNYITISAVAIVAIAIVAVRRKLANA